MLLLLSHHLHFFTDVSEDTGTPWTGGDSPNGAWVTSQCLQIIQIFILLHLLSGASSSTFTLRTQVNKWRNNVHSDRWPQFTEACSATSCKKHALPSEIPLSTLMGPISSDVSCSIRFHYSDEGAVTPVANCLTDSEGINWSVCLSIFYFASYVFSIISVRE